VDDNQLVELFVDESALLSPLFSFAFYDEVDRLNPRVVGRPHGDCVRLFQQPQPLMRRSSIQMRDTFYLSKQTLAGL
jgi:hypothetical protein